MERPDETGLRPTAATLERIVQALTTALEEEANVKAVFGAPIKLEDTLIVPVATVEVSVGGMAGMGGSRLGRAAQGALELARRFVPRWGAGGGGGFRMRIRPIGFIHEVEGGALFSPIGSGPSEQHH